MSYTVMSDEILKEFDSKIYFAVTKIRNDRKRPEINTILKEVTKTPIFNDITKDVYKIELITTEKWNIT